MSRSSPRWAHGLLWWPRTAINNVVFWLVKILSLFLHCLIEIKLLGKCLILCFVDFSKAFDMVNRNILFYKIIKSGWYGKVTDTLRSLYEKTSFRVKHQGCISFLIRNLVGVNQGGVASGFLFRKYLSDLDEYLDIHFVVWVGDMIVAHILWADDLVLMAESISGMQDQLSKLSAYCSKNLLSVNETKTKCMAIGHSGNLNL